MNRERFLGNGAQRLPRRKGPLVKFIRIAIGMTMQTLKEHAVGTPGKTLGGISARQGRRSGVRCWWGALTDWPDGIVEIRPLRLAPTGPFNVNLMGAIRPDISRGIVKEAEDHVGIQLIEAADHLPLIGAKPKALCRIKFSGIPLAFHRTQLQM